MPTDPNAIEQARKPLPLDEAARRLVKAANWMYDVLVGRGMAGGYDAAAMERASNATLSAIRKVEAALNLLSGVTEDVEALARVCESVARELRGQITQNYGEDADYLDQAAATLRAQAAQLAATPAPDPLVQVEAEDAIARALAACEWAGPFQTTPEWDDLTHREQHRYLLKAKAVTAAIRRAREGQQ